MKSLNWMCMVLGLTFLFVGCDPQTDTDEPLPVGEEAVEPIGPGADYEMEEGAETDAQPPAPAGDATGVDEGFAPEEGAAGTPESPAPEATSPEATAPEVDVPPINLDESVDQPAQPAKDAPADEQSKDAPADEQSKDAPVKEKEVKDAPAPEGDN